MKKTSSNISKALSLELEWFTAVLETRLKLYFGHECEYQTIEELTPHHAGKSSSPHANLVNQYALSFGERLVLILSLVPYLKPELLDLFFVKNKTYDREFTEFGGYRTKSHGGFLPTAQTALFILAGDDLAKKLQYLPLFSQDNTLFKHHILTLEGTEGKEPYLFGLLSPADQYRDLILNGEEKPLNYSADFPAQLLTTDLNWEDLVLEEETEVELQQIHTWIKHGHTLLNGWGLGKSVKPGFRAIFHGPSGTGKTLSATLLGKATGKTVYRIDLSKVVSKYIGETEKNLARVFDLAQHRNWILFFDEADSLFGKRTNVSNSHDRYANQEVSYLLQRIEDFPGIVILATNMKSNLDPAFTRRFQSVIHFPMPKPAERFKLWSRAFSPQSELDTDIDLTRIAEDHEISGGSVINVVRYSSLEALNRKSNVITLADLETGIRREFKKEGKTV